jgi:hypothetical protein
VSRVFRHAAAALLLLIVSAACRDANIVINVYDTADEARAAGAVASRYLPDGLPPGASDIREAHDPNTGRHWALFTFPVADREAVRAMLEPEERPLDGVAVEVPGRVEWWPILLRDQLDAAQIHATGLEVYRTRGGKGSMAVNWLQGRAYYWAP